jgi:hypothetical protein
VKLALGGSTPDAVSKTFEYNWYTDTKQFTEVAAVGEWWLQQSMSRETRAIWRYEAAWFEAPVLKVRIRRSTSGLLRQFCKLGRRCAALPSAAIHFDELQKCGRSRISPRLVAFDPAF